MKRLGLIIFMLLCCAKADAFASVAGFGSPSWSWNIPCRQSSVTAWPYASSRFLQGEELMIVDSIANASLYYSLSPGIEIALRFLASTDLMTLAPGRHELSGGCYANVQDYETAPREKKRWEAHRKYVDVQFIASGCEQIGCACIGSGNVRSVEDYKDSGDIEWFEGDGSFIRAEAGKFVILYPHEAHMPGVADGSPGQVRKVVVKVPVERP
jgi:YhcH/YjgK/YiaL family protein